MKLKIMYLVIVFVTMLVKENWQKDKGGQWVKGNQEIHLVQ